MSEWNDAIEAAAKAAEETKMYSQFETAGDFMRRAAKSIRSLKRPADQDGWKLVPIRPTDEMLLAAFNQAEKNLLDYNSDNTHCKSNEERSAHSIRPIYKAMLAAAPTPEAK